MEKYQGGVRIQTQYIRTVAKNGNPDLIPSKLGTAEWNESTFLPWIQALPLFKFRSDFVHYATFSFRNCLHPDKNHPDCVSWSLKTVSPVECFRPISKWFIKNSHTFIDMRCRWRCRWLSMEAQKAIQQPMAMITIPSDCCMDKNSAMIFIWPIWMAATTKKKSKSVPHKFVAPAQIFYI